MYVLEVVEGKHRQGDKVITSGERFESPKPLHKVFTNKFMLIEVTDKTGKTVAPRPRKREDFVLVRHLCGRGKFKIYRIPKAAADDISQSEVPAIGKAMNDGFLTKREAMDWLKGEGADDIVTADSEDPIYADVDDVVEEVEEQEEEEAVEEQEEEEAAPEPAPKKKAPARRSRKKK
jgi:hypothetical protein